MSLQIIALFFKSIQTNNRLALMKSKFIGSVSEVNMFSFGASWEEAQIRNRWKRKIKVSSSLGFNPG